MMFPVQYISARKGGAIYKLHLCHEGPESESHIVLSVFMFCC